MARNKRIPGSKKDKKLKKQKKREKRSLAVGRILIVCEGEQTEPNYFKWWQKELEAIRMTAKSKAVSGIDVKKFDDKIEVAGEGRNTTSLVEKAIELKNQASIDYTQVWCVFDRDSFPSENYNTAIVDSVSKGYKAAYSNEAFELWYLLHFDYINTGVARTQYKKMLSKRMGEKYKKNDPIMYEMLFNHPDADQQRAIKNAKKLLQLNKKGKNYSKYNPSTTVFELVESLNEHVWKFRCQFAPDYPLPYSYDCKDCQKSTQLPSPYPCIKTS
ncbi:RloB family protein [Desulfobacterales bacterium HSG17]|nr:RloB family protein [Desulfobacterales bacterium HSG17]